MKLIVVIKAELSNAKSISQIRPVAGTRFQTADKTSDYPKKTVLPILKITERSKQYFSTLHNIHPNSKN